ncbi:MAG TPA: cytochrome-c oxidase, cbb3-type subunit I [Gemmatimonas aurantiaca]|uniref:cytochrome-c oxidase n=2 Tax=Gemmatimonas aurantiaca TaxID=173480 RepID=C1AE90_GEMAT|nr:cytochrome-c oxidase, cbb3-type subunit I [Gemmatimonas aurantiaca]BAH40817.1 cytochrome c oxidase cbb3-type subunit I/mono-heme subunit [Gemmatimonas aurantiaca T-27]HCT59088.1 cytochrome-c oxidase, cbb3-type subunit I [Gemmatimonas aurantiaca]
MTSAPSAVAPSAATLDRFSYDDDIVRKFLFATLIWGVVGMVVGLLIALQLASPVFNFNTSFLSFGRLRPLHTNAVIFAFAGNAFFTGCYYSTQRLLKARMFSDGLSKFHFWGWQAIILSAALTLPFGYTQAKEYAELEWPIDIAIAVVWVAFAVNFFGTLIRRRERHIYVALWFYIASIVTVAILHIFNNLAMPAGMLKSYSIYAGVQDAFMQWWYGHNAVAFFLTTPFLGLMYYFMPKAAEGPVFSYKLSILHFWSLVFMYIWAGPHHLHYTALPEWASTVGMLFSVMLWAPSWGGMINGLLTLRGAWHKVAQDPILKFFVVAITAYGMATFEGPMLSIKSVNALSHYTDWIIAHVHTGALGWNGFMTFGMAYWLLPRLFQTEIYSKRAMELHFWISSVGIVLYVVAIYSAGVTQGLMWRAFDETGRLAYPDFVETVLKLMPMYWMRVVGGTFYIVGMFIFGWNVFKTWANRPARYDVPVIEAAPLAPRYVPDHPVIPAKGLWARFNQVEWHRSWERAPMLFTALTVLAVVVASLFEILPTFLIKSNVPTIASVKPYTPLELAGRDIYIAEGCFNCHSQMVRPFRYETERFGEYSKPGESVYEHPFLWGSRRIGPDLARQGGKYPDLWHVRHFEDPRAVTAKSIMPAYAHFSTTTLDFNAIQSRVDAMAMVGVPYGDALNRAPDMAREQAKQIAAAIVEQGGPAGLEDKQMVAIVAYMQRLGRDIKVTTTSSNTTSSNAPSSAASAPGAQH